MQVFTVLKYNPFYLKMEHALCTIDWIPVDKSLNPSHRYLLIYHFLSDILL